MELIPKLVKWAACRVVQCKSHFARTDTNLHYCNDQGNLQIRHPFINWQFSISLGWVIVLLIFSSQKKTYIIIYIYIYNSDMILIPADLSTIYVVKSAREVNNHQIKFFVLWFTIFMDCTGIPSLDLQLNMHQLVRQSPNGQCQKNPKKMLGKSTTSFPIPAGSST
jgi:hypothetical protein